jgi:hypothetical protein
MKLEQWEEEDRQLVAAGIVPRIGYEQGVS